jgi:transcriptional regulator with XRE-family HTH domain
MAAMLEADQRRLLGEFVRAHRERMAPTTPTGRRRTAGLRREELAQRAGISVTWCTWIEQGRPVQASPEALGRIARALSLSRAERDYLFELAGRVDPKERAGRLRMPLPPSSPRSRRSNGRPMDSTGSGMRAHGTKRRRGFFTAGSTGIVSATCCGLCFWALPPAR